MYQTQMVLVTCIPALLPHAQYLCAHNLYKAQHFVMKISNTIIVFLISNIKTSIRSFYNQILSYVNPLSRKTVEVLEGSYFTSSNPC